MTLAQAMGMFAIGMFFGQGTLAAVTHKPALLLVSLIGMAVSGFATICWTSSD